MDEFETPLQKAERHFAEGKARVSRQKALVAELEKGGFTQASAIGRQLLGEMQNYLIIALEHLEQERRGARQELDRHEPGVPAGVKVSEADRIRPLIVGDQHEGMSVPSCAPPDRGIIRYGKVQRIRNPFCW